MRSFSREYHHYGYFHSELSTVHGSLKLIPKTLNFRPRNREIVSVNKFLQPVNSSLIKPVGIAMHPDTFFVTSNPIIVYVFGLMEGCNPFAGIHIYPFDGLPLCRRECN